MISHETSPHICSTRSVSGKRALEPWFGNGEHPGSTSSTSSSCTQMGTLYHLGTRYSDAFRQQSRNS
eukprot:3336149-Rhodomonas_salina.1